MIIIESRTRGIKFERHKEESLISSGFLKNLKKSVEGHLWKAQWKEKPNDEGHSKLTMNS